MPHLIIFQLLVLPLIALLCATSLVKTFRGKHRRAVALATAVWLAAGIAVLRPDATIQIARWMGIGRGTDLVLYFFVIAFLAAAFYFYHRIVQLEAALTTMVRETALRDATAQKDGSVQLKESFPLTVPARDKKN